jgi:VIT1/CCC1 family predicted Fe2+/Mn2+ transporter
MSALDSWQKEMDSVFIYRVIAQGEKAPEKHALFKKLAADAESQAEIWAKKMHAEGQTPPAFVPGMRTRLVAALVRRFGARRLRTVLAAMKVRGMSVFTAVLAGHPLPRSADEIGQRHRSAGGGNLRALVFGANDGLVSNAGLILGVAGATGGTGEARAIVVSGIAGLLAGAFSMASGEYVSVRSQREMFEHQIAAERDELETYPEAEAAELATIYEARGLSRDDANHMAASIIRNPAYALDALAREELGLDPANLGSPWAAAGSSFLSFSLGAVVPLLPFLVARDRHGLLASVAVTAVALFGIGAAISLFTGRSAWRGGVRMLLIGAAAAGATYSIGRLLDVTVS